MSKILNWSKVFVSICGGWWSAMSGAVSIPLGLVALILGGSTGFWFAILAAIGLIVFAVGVVRENLRLHTPSFEIEGIPSDIKTPGRYFCQLRVINKSPTRTADNVQVELLALEDSLGHAAEAAYFRPSFPVILKPEITGANTINPGASLTYNLFHVIMGKGGTPNGNVIVWHWNFVAYFTQETEFPRKNATQFLAKQNYRLKLRTTARDFVKVEREFNLNFSDEGSFCRFTLSTPTRLDMPQFGIADKR